MNRRDILRRRDPSSQRAHGLSGRQQVALVLLRVAIGWHFLYEGWVKLVDPGWTSAGALAAAQGPLAGVFRELSTHWRILEVVDRAMSWGLAAVGLGLIVGLLTRAATVAAAGLLVLFYLMNPPVPGMEFLPGEGSYLIVNKILVELFALGVLLAFPTGTVAGLDRLLKGRGRAIADGAKVVGSKPPPEGTP
jgi:thiosulfate dehydrogenase [quinone] large subunit